MTIINCNEPQNLRILFATLSHSTFSCIESVWCAAFKHENIVAKLMVFEQQDSSKRTGEFFELKEYLVNLDVPFIYYSKQSVEDFAPDIVILTVPYSNMYPSAFWSFINKKTKIIYLPSELDAKGGASSISKQFNLPIHNAAWRVFAHSYNHRRMFAKYKDNACSNVVVSGSPRIDFYQNTNMIDNKELSKKIKNRVAILWAPHFSVTSEAEVNAWSSFLYIKDHILRSFSDLYDSHFLIFRPHPLLWEELKNKNIWTNEQIEAFKNAILGLGNSIIDQNPDYRIAFKTSDAIITDANSFLAEYLWMNKPILYTFPPNGYGLNDEYACIHSAVSVLDNNSDQGINHFLCNLDSNYEIFKEKRERIREKIFFRPKNDNLVGDEIVSQIVNAWQKKDFYIPPIHKYEADEKAFSYWEKSTNTYLASPEYYNRQEKALNDILKSCPPIETACDIGCGDGRYTFILAQYSNHVHASDISDHLLTAAKNNAKNNKIKNVTFFNDSITDIKHLGRYNFVSCMGVLSGIISEAKFIQTLYYLKTMVQPKNGMLLVKESLSTGEPLYTPNHSEYVSVYRNYDQYVRLIENLGFELVEKIKLSANTKGVLENYVNFMFLFKLKGSASDEESQRIREKNIALDTHKINDFFTGRSQKIDKNNPYISVIYQDSNAKLAHSRDQHEKQLILPKLQLNSNVKLLDIGCGIGRWADVITDKIEHYVGVDFSEKFICQAREKFKNSNRKIDFEICSAQSINTNRIGYRNYFDRIIISGVLLYLNDKDIIKCFNNMQSLIAPKCILYIREPLSVTTERLTLDGVWSEDMKQNYYAIYRSKKELEHLISQGLDKNITLNLQPVYEDGTLNNRAETKQFYAILILK